MSECEQAYSYLSEKYLLKTCSTDVNGLWKISDILVQLQELAGKQCGLLGCGRLDLVREHSLVWVLTRTEIRFRRFPSLGESINITTWAAPPRRMIYPRYFTAVDAEEQTVFDAATQWVLCDIRDRKMKNAPEVGAMIPTPGREPAFTRFSAAPLIENGKRVFYAEPRYSDLDVNGHVNNTRYADWLCDALGIDTMKQKRISVITIDYRHEVTPGDRLEMTLGQSGTGFSLSGKKDDTLFFDIGGTFAPDENP